MSTQDNRLLFVPPGAGDSRWVFGDNYTFKASANDTAGSFSLIEVLVPPEAGPPLHVHHRTDEAFYLLDGTVEFTDGKTVQNIEPGGFIFVPRGSAHGFHNTGSRTAKLLTWFTPGGTEMFFKELGVPATKNIPAPPEAQRLIDAENALKILGKYDSSYL